MLIEGIFCKENTLFVGIGELRNETKKKKDELIALSSTLTRESTVVQFFAPSLIAGPMHLLSAAQNAINAVRGDYAISRSLNVEVIVYASAQRQIERAFETMGVEDNLETIAVVIINKSKDAVQDCFKLLFTEIGHDIEPAFNHDKGQIIQIMEAFEVSDTELRTFTDSENLDEIQNALVRCIVSRVSMVGIDA
jgi:KEOPS complex subunit Cgi121